MRIPSVSLHCTSHAHPTASIANPLGLSYLPSNESSAWDMYLQQIDRVSPFLGDLSRWVDTLRRPKRVLVVDVPIHLDNGRIAHFEGSNTTLRAALVKAVCAFTKMSPCPK